MYVACLRNASLGNIYIYIFLILFNWFNLKTIYFLFTCLRSPLFMRCMLSLLDALYSGFRF